MRTQATQRRRISLASLAAKPSVPAGLQVAAVLALEEEEPAAACVAHLAPDRVASLADVGYATRDGNASCFTDAGSAQPQPLGCKATSTVGIEKDNRSMLICPSCNQKLRVGQNVAAGQTRQGLPGWDRRPMSRRSPAWHEAGACCAAGRNSARVAELSSDVTGPSLPAGRMQLTSKTAPAVRRKPAKPSRRPLPITSRGRSRPVDLPPS
jgi:hypothetical protein